MIPQVLPLHGITAAPSPKGRTLRLCLWALVVAPIVLAAGLVARYEMWLTLALMLGNLAMMIALYRRQAQKSSSAGLLLPLLAAGAGLLGLPYREG